MLHLSIKGVVKEANKVDGSQNSLMLRFNSGVSLRAASIAASILLDVLYTDRLVIE